MKPKTRPKSSWELRAETAERERDQWKHLSGEAAKGLALADRQRDHLRTALVGLVGVDGRAELEQMEAVMRLMPAPAQDKAATIDAIHALIATLPDPPSGDTEQALQRSTRP